MQLPGLAFACASDSAHSVAAGASSSRCCAACAPQPPLARRAARPLQQQLQAGRRQQRASVVVAAAASDDGLESAFAAELAARQAAASAQAETQAASAFDGAALLALIRKRYGRSYDVSLVSRPYMGRTFVALNVMWKYQEQQSFSYTPQEFAQRLDYAAAALVAWGQVSEVCSKLSSTKERPRVGKAVSIMLEVPEDKAREWIAA